MSVQSDQAAEEFIRNETQFHLGFLPTEQANPLTRDLEERFQQSPVTGVNCLQRVDHAVLAMSRHVFASLEYRKLAEGMLGTIRTGHRVVFSGCGATGRLSILLEGMWRDVICEEYQSSVASIMTGGDFALIRSVEFFEDYASFTYSSSGALGSPPCCWGAPKPNCAFAFTVESMAMMAAAKKIFFIVVSINCMLFSELSRKLGIISQIN